MAQRNSFRGHRFPRHVILLFYRDVWDMLAEQGITVDAAAVFRWVQKDLKPRFTLGEPRYAAALLPRRGSVPREAKLLVDGRLPTTEPIGHVYTIQPCRTWYS